MAQEINYAESTVDKIIRFLKGDNGSIAGYFKSFYYGDPLKMAISSLPAVVVQLTKTQVVAGPTGMDAIQETIEIILMYNKRNDFGKNDKEATSARRLEEFAQGNDPTTSLYSANSVLGIIRQQITLEDYIVSQDVSIEYNTGIRPEDTLTGEARITMVVKRLVQVNGRT